MIRILTLRPLTAWQGLPKAGDSRQRWTGSAFGWADGPGQSAFHSHGRSSVCAALGHPDALQSRPCFGSLGHGLRDHFHLQKTHSALGSSEACSLGSTRQPLPFSRAVRSCQGHETRRAGLLGLPSSAHPALPETVLRCTSQHVATEDLLKF